MDALQVSLAVFSIFIVSTAGDHEYMVKNAEPIAVPLQFERKLQCMMNIEPDKFQWKFYPLPKKDVFNPNAIINLSKDRFEMVPIHNFTSRRNKSDLTLQARGIEVAGDYQCLAYYGASVVASVPWRVTIATLGEFPPQDNLDLIVTPNNTVTWRCEPPEANPEPFIDYYKDLKYIPNKSASGSTKSLVLEHVEPKDGGRYSCRAGNSVTDKPSPFAMMLRVVPSNIHYPPRFVVSQRKIYTVIKGESVFLECAGIGNPAPTIVWRKEVGQIPYDRTEMLPGGLLIKNVSSEDDGTYTCTLKNLEGSIDHRVTLVYSEKPSIECLLNSTDVKQGEQLDLECSVRGKPEPQLSWFLNGFSVTNDSAVEAIGDKIYFRPVEKRHAGNLQLFARNIVKTAYSSISIKVIPLSQSVDVLSVVPTRSHHNNRHSNRGNSNRKNQKHPKCIPPTKPSISRMNDETVVVRWNVSENKGLPIQFFKVQYRELGSANQSEHYMRKSSKWMTANTEIKPHIRSYEVNGLKPDHVYRFRIAAVYTNNDNKIGPTSDKFHLTRNDFDNRNLLPVPLITHTEPINSTSVRLYWKCEPVRNISIDGFFVNYISASRAGDYMKDIVDGENSTSFVLSHLTPDTFYDIKLQSFNSETASLFSSIMKAKTAALTTEKVKEHTVPPSSSTGETDGVISKLYITIAVGVVSAGLVIILVVGLLLYCRKWKQKKNVNRNVRDKPPEDHHIQADGNEYVVGPKSAPRMNGSVPPNRITITANPLADADNKNQNMIEMSCLSSQNNNCSAPTTAASNNTNAIHQPSASGEESTSTPAKDNNKKIKNTKRIRNKNMDNPPGENYV